MTALNVSQLVVGDKYNWKNQSDRLIYIGQDGRWCQFALVNVPDEVWCEVLADNIDLLEVTQ